MATLTQQSLAVIAGFSKRPGVTDDHVRNLHAAVAGSPALAEQFNRAVASGVVKDITVLTNTNAGAEYDPVNDAIRVPISRLGNPQGPQDRAEITFTMGHEVQHGLNSPGIDRMRARFRQDVIERAQSPGSVHDYTDIVQGKLNANRTDEAMSHVAGWNALASMVKQSNPNATLADVYAAHRSRADDFVTLSNSVPPTAVPKSGLAFSSDLSLEETRQNLEATAKHWYANVPPSLGRSGTADYPNFYANSAISTIVQFERHYHPPTPGVSTPVVGLDMRALKLSEKQLEEAGLDFGTDTNPMTYLDMSRTPHSSHLFQHTKTTLKHAAPVPEASVDAAASRPDVEEKLRHPLHQQADELVRQADRGMGRTSDGASDRMAASVARLAREHGFERIDHVVLSRQTHDKGAGATVFAVQGDLHNPAHRRAHMSTQEAVSTPVEESVQALARLESMGQKALERQQAQALSMEQQAAPTRGIA